MGALNGRNVRKHVHYIPAHAHLKCLKTQLVTNWRSLYRKSPGGRSDGLHIGSVGGRAGVTDPLVGAGRAADLGEISDWHRADRRATNCAAEYLRFPSRDDLPLKTRVPGVRSRRSGRNPPAYPHHPLPATDGRDTLSERYRAITQSIPEALPLQYGRAS